MKSKKIHQINEKGNKTQDVKGEFNKDIKSLKKTR
jgi:hypothetical protein